MLTLLAYFAGEPPAPSSAASSGLVAQANIKEPSEEALTLYECGICFGRATHLHKCGVCEASYCTNCMRTYIKHKVQDNGLKQLVCPVCQHALSEELIKEALADSSTFQPHTTSVENETTNGIRFCPRLGCGAALKEPPHSRHRHVLCSSCHEESCLRCGGEFHKIPICRSLSKKLRKLKKRQQKNMRACPKCKLAVERSDYESHYTTCTHCLFQFCWVCVRPKEGHSSKRCAWRANFRLRFRNSSIVRAMVRSASIIGTFFLAVVGGALSIVYSAALAGATIVWLVVRGVVFTALSIPNVVYEICVVWHRHQERCTQS